MFTWITTKLWFAWFTSLSYTKMGYAGNTEPQFIMPSAIAIKETAKVGEKAARRLAHGIEDLDFSIGDEALDATNYTVKVSCLIYVLLLGQSSVVEFCGT